MGFSQNGFVYRKNSQLGNIPTEELNKCSRNFSFVGKKTLWPTGYLCAKIETTDSNK